jgi:hypothetical protein
MCTNSALVVVVVGEGDNTKTMVCGNFLVIWTQLSNVVALVCQYHPKTHMYGALEGLPQTKNRENAKIFHILKTICPRDFKLGSN